MASVMCYHCDRLRINIIAAFHSTKKFWKRGQMVWKLHGKGSRKYGNCRIPENRTIQPKISENPELKSYETGFPG